MPTQQSVSVCNINALTTPCNEMLSEDKCLQLLRKKECLAYHHVCGVFRAQGHLTPEKLKLLKEIASTLSISDVRHKAECRIAVNNRELNAIAECVSGPNTDLEWRREAQEERLLEPEERVCSASLQMADALARAVYESLNSVSNHSTISKTVSLKSLWLKEAVNSDEKESNQRSENSNNDIKEEISNLKTEDEIKEEDKDAELSSSVSTTSELPEEPQSPEEMEYEENITEVEKEAKPDSDTILMPPPSITGVCPCPVSADPPTSPVITAPPPTHASIVSLPTNPTIITVPPSSSIPALSPSPAVITVPPSSSILALSPPHPAVITVPPPTSLPDISSTSVSPPPSVIPTSSGLLTTPPLTSTCEIDECTPVLSEDMQFVSFSESMDASLPSLVVVPPPEPIITVPHSSSFSSTPTTPTLVLPSGMSIQLREESEDSKKRKRSLSQDSGISNGSSAPSSKTMAFSHISKMTPVMVSVASMSAAGLKVTPTISRAKMAVTTQANLTSSTQKL